MCRQIGYFETNENANFTLQSLPKTLSIFPRVMSQICLLD